MLTSYYKQKAEREENGLPPLPLNLEEIQELVKIIVEKYCEITGNDYINTCEISTYNYKKLFKIND